MRDGTRRRVVLLSLMWGGVLAWGQTAVDLRTQAKSVDFAGASMTRPFRTGVALPATCLTGEAYFLTSAPAGQNLFGCVAANTWALLLGGGGAGAGSFAQIGGIATLGQGGTGAVTAELARGNLGAAATGHTHQLGDLAGVSGKRGTGTVLQTFGGGSTTAGDCAQFDADGNVVSSGLPCGAGSGTGGYGQSFTAQTSVTLAHGLGTRDVSVRCYDEAERAVEPDRTTVTDDDTVAVTFQEPQTGRCAVGSGGGGGAVLGGTGIVVGGGTTRTVALDTALVPTFFTGVGSPAFTGIGAGACQEREFDLLGAVQGDAIVPRWPSGLTAGLAGLMYVGGPGRVTVRLCNSTGAAVTPGTGLVYGATVLRSF